MRLTQHTVCLLLTGLLCVVTISECSSNERTESSSVTESRTSGGHVSVSDNFSSEYSSADDVSDESATKESSAPKESNAGEESVPTQNIFT